MLGTMVLCSKGRMASDVAAGVNFQATQYVAILYAAQVYIIKKTYICTSSS
jgi:hypothetical protein